MGQRCIDSRRKNDPECSSAVLPGLIQEEIRRILTLTGQLSCRSLWRWKTATLGSSNPDFPHRRASDVMWSDPVLGSSHSESRVQTLGRQCERVLVASTAAGFEAVRLTVRIFGEPGLVVLMR